MTIDRLRIFRSGPCRRLLVVPMIALAACGSDTPPNTGSASPGTTTASASPATDSAAISLSPWLRERLPEDTIAYFRLPSPWATLAAPNGRQVDRMYASQAHVDAIAAIRKALAGFNRFEAEGEGGAEVDQVIQALNAISGPIEVAMVAPGKAFSPSAQALVSVPLDTDDVDRVARHLRTLSRQDTDDTQLFDEKGYGTLLGSSGMNVAVHFDTTLRRLYLLAGQRAEVDALRALVIATTAAAPGEHAMHPLESEIDGTGQGLFAWLDVAAARPLLMMTLNNDTLWMRHLYNATEAVALGWGAVDGHGRLSVRAQVREPAWLDYLPHATRRLDIDSRSEPGYVFSLALPTIDEIDATVTAASASDPSIGEGWQAVNEAVLKETGITLADWWRPFGSELVSFNDDAGSFSALRLRDADAWHRLLEQVKAAGHEVRLRDVDGGSIHHLSFRTDPASRQQGGDSDTQRGALWASLPTHVYLLEDDGWLLAASVPQPLIDRLALSDRVGIDDWLRRTQGDDRSRALLSLSGQARHLTRFQYYLYLSLIELLNDVTGAEVDLFALPTARQLDLPAMTGAGVQLIANDTRIALDFNYQNSALDGALGGGGAPFVMVAVAGTLSAIALPAYQDYTLRAEVAKAFTETGPLRLQLIEHYASTGRLQTDAKALDQPLRRLASGHGRIEFDNGAIAIVFDDDAPLRLAGGHLYLLPHRDNEGELHFVCGDAEPPAGAEPLVAMEPGIERTDLPRSMLPSQCRH